MYFICAKILHAAKVDDPVDAVPIHAVIFIYYLQGMWIIGIVLCGMVFKNDRNILWVWNLLMGCLGVGMHLFHWLVCCMAYCVYTHFEGSQPIESAR